MPNGRLFGKTSPPPRCLMRRDLRGTGYTTLYPRRYYTQNTRACGQCNKTYTILHTLTTCTATSELWQWTSHKIAVVVFMDPRYVPPQWLLLPGNFWLKMKRQAKIWLIGHYVHYVVQNGSSVTLHDCKDFLRRAFKLKRDGKRTTSLALTWRNVHGEILIRLGTLFL